MLLYVNVEMKTHLERERDAKERRESSDQNRREGDLPVIHLNYEAKDGGGSGASPKLSKQKSSKQVLASGPKGAALRECVGGLVTPEALMRRYLVKARLCGPQAEQAVDAVREGCKAAVGLHGDLSTIHLVGVPCTAAACSPRSRRRWSTP